LSTKPRINLQIRSPQLRVITDAGENLGVISLEEAVAAAKERGLDLIEISPTATPPVAKIMDFGKYQYVESKKQKQTKQKAHITETKQIQVKVATGEHDLELKAKKASEWLGEGHRVKIDLFITGRTKYMDPRFLLERLDRVLKLISVEYKVAEEAKKGIKGYSMVIERKR
jgi:translation initiation factor IF-3